jgi:hypothetical protein
MSAAQTALAQLAQELADRGFVLDDEINDCQWWKLTITGRPALWVQILDETFDDDGIPHSAPLTVYVQYDGTAPQLEIPLAAPNMLAAVISVLDGPFIAPKAVTR